MKNIIIAPHADDEIIGCFDVLNRSEECIVIFPNRTAYNEAEEAAKKLAYKRELCIYESDLFDYIKIDAQLFFPDPYFELHPDHRYWGAVGEKLLRRHNCNVTFYVTSMLAPYIHETEYANEKRETLNSCYSQKSDLWQYDHKYYLFEGYNDWLIGKFVRDE